MGLGGGGVAGQIKRSLVLDVATKMCRTCRVARWAVGWVCPQIKLTNKKSHQHLKNEDIKGVPCPLVCSLQVDKNPHDWPELC